MTPAAAQHIPPPPLLSEVRAAAYLSARSGRHWSVAMVKRRALAGRLAHHPRWHGRGYRAAELDAFLAALSPADLPPATARPGTPGTREAVSGRRAERVRRVAGLRAEGRSLRQIAAAVGVTAEQVRKDLLAAGGRESSTGGGDARGTG